MFTGTGSLTRLNLRRARILIPVWVLVIAALVLGTASSFTELYPTRASRIPFAQSITANSGLIALTGRPFDLLSTGGLTAWRSGSLGAVLAAIMSLLLVTRHTRAEEESGRLELIAAGVVGRFAPLAAGVLTALIANLAVVVLVTAGLAAQGLPAAGGLALGLAVASAGVVFTAVSAVAAQLTKSGRPANGIGSALVGVAYLLRALGDATDAHWVSWLSPIGWAQQLRPFAGNRWVVLLLPAAALIAGLAAAFALNARRDLGAGLIPSRPGRPTASPWLGSSTGLAWRLQRGSLIGWSAGLFVVGLVGGALAQSVGDLTADNPQLADLLQQWGGSQGVADAYLATVLGMTGIISAAYAVQAVLRLPAEESSQRAEPLLATPVGRIPWALGHLGVALIGTALLDLTAGIGAGLAHGLQTHDLSGQFGRVLAAALVQIPAAWVFAGLTLLLFGLLPAWAAIGWAAVVAALVLLLLGPVLKLSHWVLDASPFAQLPALPGGSMDWAPVGWLLVLTLVLCAAGTAGLRHRDLR
jgi:polyether ionophore transport system permease protein